MTLTQVFNLNLLDIKWDLQFLNPFEQLFLLIIFFYSILIILLIVIFTIFPSMIFTVFMVCFYHFVLFLHFSPFLLLITFYFAVNFIYFFK